ncbi:MAG: DNA repair protein RecN [Prevotellaceae bacterium]|jgi:DNA repair protein RecN (Recombination protein N)|nr:DNA repair protein RecN [Prevotellaceae bacterium]
MLQSLEIDNYALIEHLRIDFEHGLSVITGETGAGKSIILGALALVRGQRADTKVIQQGKTKCVVEAVFDVSPYRLETLFAEMDVDYFPHCIVRREIADNGKSRSFINDTPVSLAQMRDVMTQLIDIHSQHESLLLGNTNFQTDVVDAMAHTQAEKAQYLTLFNAHRDLLTEFARLTAQAEQWRADRDYAQFQYDKLSEASLSNGEQVALEQELDTINHIHEVKTALATALSLLNREESGVVAALKETFAAIGRVRNHLPQADDYVRRLDSAAIDLKDIASDIHLRLNDLDFDAQRKEWVEQRLDLIYNLEQKHRVATVEELLALQEQFAAQLERIDHCDEAVEQMQKELAQVERQLCEAADALSQKRIQNVAPVSELVTKQLAALGMLNVQFTIRITAAGTFRTNGRDEIEFLFSANKNRLPQPVSQIASGGELSRLMLVIKALMAANVCLPTIIFDEIDAGVSGDVAGKFGAVLHRMSRSMQVIAITHLPQIAARGDVHYKVFKKDSALATFTGITRLAGDERIDEIAEMLSGKNPSSAARANACELLQNNN